MESASKLIQMAFAAIVFCISIVLLFFESKTYNCSLATVRELYKDDYVIYMQYNPDDAVIVSYSELIATLMEPLDYDITVDGLQIKKLEHTADQISTYGIQNADYAKSYRYNDNGDIVFVIYTRIS